MIYFNLNSFSKLLPFIAVSLFPIDASSTEDPAVLQKNAIERIETFIDHFRKTGDHQSRLPDLEKAEQELLISQNQIRIDLHRRNFCKDVSLENNETVLDNTRYKVLKNNAVCI